MCEYMYVNVYTCPHSCMHLEESFELKKSNRYKISPDKNIHIPFIKE